ncbi:MAG TPA: hypothetical protein VF316_22260 [Polyangiaceae bacterium]
MVSCLALCACGAGDASSLLGGDPSGSGLVDAGTTDAGKEASRPLDDAVIVNATFPATLDCGGTGTAKVTVRNTGASTWTLAAGYGLGAVGDSDPLYTADNRIRLGGSDSVLPGGERTFDIPLGGPTTPQTYTTDWQMVHESVGWFGATTTHAVVVGVSGPPPIDLGKTVVRNSPPDVATWAETTKITKFDMNLDGVFIDFSKRDGSGSWPDVPFGAPGDSLEYSLWIVLYIGGTWYTSGCIQYWRGLDRNGGPPSGYAANWYYDANRWGPMTGHQPAVGELVGFFVTAGNARNVNDKSGSIVYERSNVITIPFPADPGAVFTF